MRDLVESRGGNVVAGRYASLDASEDDVRALVAGMIRLEADAVFSTVVGRSAR